MPLNSWLSMSRLWNGKMHVLEMASLLPSNSFTEVHQQSYEQVRGVTEIKLHPNIEMIACPRRISYKIATGPSEVCQLEDWDHLYKPWLAEVMCEKRYHTFYRRPRPCAVILILLSRPLPKFSNLIKQSHQRWWTRYSMVVCLFQHARFIQNEQTKCV